MVGLRGRVLLRLRPALVVPVVALLVLLAAVAALVAAVANTDAVAVVLVSFAVAVVSMVRSFTILVSAGRALRVADRLSGRRDPGSRPGADRKQPAAGRRGGRRGCRCRCRRRRGRAGRARGRARARLGRGERGRDDRGDLAGSGRRGRDGGLRGWLAQEVWRGQNEADGHRHGEHAECRSRYARKTTPHSCPNRRSCACLES